MDESVNACSSSIGRSINGHQLPIDRSINREQWTIITTQKTGIREKICSGTPQSSQVRLESVPANAAFNTDTNCCEPLTHGTVLVSRTLE
eukprot:146992-Amphidinium_carterae.1